MHKEQINYCLSVKNKHPELFKGKILDCGSLDINGNNRYLFEDTSEYVGIDVGIGNNVDIVCQTHKFNGLFDVIISTECFEHDMYYKESILNIIHMLKPGGLFLFTCATTGRKEHGTSKIRNGSDCPLTQNDAQWKDYYKNLEEKDIREIIDVDNIFSEYEFSNNFIYPAFDLYFYGIKKIK